MSVSLQIDELRLSLPPGWQGHAQLFARHLSRLLGELEFAGDGSVDQLRLPPIEARPGESYQAVARRVARQVQVQVNASNNRFRTNASATATPSFPSAVASGMPSGPLSSTPARTIPVPQPSTE